MSGSSVDLEVLVKAALDAMTGEEGAAARADTMMRERFFELMVLILGNLHAKTPVASALFDRATMMRVTDGMDDVDAGKLTGRTEDWLRIEGLLRQQDGAKAYSLPRATLAVLSTITASGTLGEVFEKILQCYVEKMPTERLRSATRILGSYFVGRVARS